MGSKYGKPHSGMPAYRQIAGYSYGSYSRPQRLARLSGEWTSRIDQRIAELQCLIIRAGLTQCIGCDVFRLTNASLQIRPIEPGAWDPDRGIGSVEFSRLKAPLPAGNERLSGSVSADQQGASIYLL